MKARSASSTVAASPMSKLHVGERSSRAFSWPQARQRSVERSVPPKEPRLDGQPRAPERVEQHARQLLHVVLPRRLGGAPSETPVSARVLSAGAATAASAQTAARAATARSGRSRRGLVDGVHLAAHLLQREQGLQQRVQVARRARVGEASADTASAAAPPTTPRGRATLAPRRLARVVQRAAALGRAVRLDALQHVALLVLRRARHARRGRGRRRCCSRRRGPPSAWRRRIRRRSTCRVGHVDRESAACRECANCARRRIALAGECALAARSARFTPGGGYSSTPLACVESHDPH